MELNYQYRVLTSLELPSQVLIICDGKYFSANLNTKSKGRTMYRYLQTIDNKTELWIKKIYYAIMRIFSRQTCTVKLCLETSCMCSLTYLPLRYFLPKGLKILSVALLDGTTISRYLGV